MQQIRTEMGVLEATMQIPAIFLKRLLGQNRLRFPKLEREYSVRLNYNESKFNDECYPLSEKTSILIKGCKDNIVNVHRAIQKLISEWEV